MGLIDRIRSGTYVPDGPPLAARGTAATLADTAGRIARGEDVLPAARDFLDGAGRATPVELEALIRDEPPLTGSERGDALLAGLAEHFAATREVRCPAWTQAPGRFLDCFWFVSDTPGFRAISLAQSPVALKRRGIMWPARSLERV